MVWLVSELGFLFLQGTYPNTIYILSLWLLRYVQSEHLEGRRAFRALSVLWFPTLILRYLSFMVFSLRGFRKGVQSSISKFLICTYWGDLILSGSVLYSWYGSEIPGESNGVINLVIPFWQVIRLSFKVISLFWVAFVHNFLVSVIPDSLPPDNNSLDVFPYLGLPFSTIGFHFSAVFTLTLTRWRG